MQEVNTFLELEKRDKESLRGKLKEQNETIHQLTHHLKLLNTNQHLNSSNMMSNNMGLYSNGSVGFAGVPINASGNTRTPIQSTVISTPHSVSISHAPPPSIDVHTIPLAPWDETALPIVQTLRNAPSASMSASAHLRASYPAGSIGNVVQTSTPSTTNSTKRRGPSSHSSHIQ